MFQNDLHPRTLQWRLILRTPQDHPKTPQVGTKIPQNRPKTASKRPKTDLKTASRRPKTTSWQIAWPRLPQAGLTRLKQMSVDIPSHMYRICLSCKHFELQRFWVAKVLSCKRFELQKFWIAKVLSCKSYELQHFWAAKVLNCKTKVLSFRWDGKLLLTKKVAPNRKEMSSVKNVRLSFGFIIGITVEPYRFRCAPFMYRTGGNTALSAIVHVLSAEMW